MLPKTAKDTKDSQSRLDFFLMYLFESGLIEDPFFHDDNDKQAPVNNIYPISQLWIFHMRLFHLFLVDSPKNKTNVIN